MFFPNVGGEYVFRQKVFYKNVNLQYSFTISSKSPVEESRFFRLNWQIRGSRLFVTSALPPLKNHHGQHLSLTFWVPWAGGSLTTRTNPPRRITYHHAQRSKDGFKKRYKIEMFGRSVKCQESEVPGLQPEEQTPCSLNVPHSPVKQ